MPRDDFDPVDADLRRELDLQAEQDRLEAIREEAITPYKLELEDLQNQKRDWEATVAQAIKIHENPDAEIREGASGWDIADHIIGLLKNGALKTQPMVSAREVSDVIYNYLTQLKKNTVCIEMPNVAERDLMRRRHEELVRFVIDDPTPTLNPG